MKRRWTSCCAAVVMAGLAVPAPADVFVLTNGDRVTGKRLRTTRTSYVVQTDYGRLTIPRARIERIVKEDGTEEAVNAPGAGITAGGAGTGLMPMAKLVLIVVGKSFWLAWDPKNNPGVDPSLRMEVQLDGETVASYVDAKPDPKDLPGATVNTFSFLAGDFEMEAGRASVLAPPEVRPGRASLRIDVPFPSDAPATRKLRVAYQFNAGTAEEPDWKDAVSAETTFDIARGTPTFILMRQDPGRMQFSGFPRRRMRNIETFHMDIAPGS